MLGIKECKQELVDYVAENEDSLWSFAGASFFVSGAAGLIGSYLIDFLFTTIGTLGTEISICACDRDTALQDRRFPDGRAKGGAKLLIDVYSSDLPTRPFDYVIHAVRNISPVDYVTKPIDTIWTNVFGAKKLLDLAITAKAKRFPFCSSVEAYGRNNGDTDFFREDYSGYVDSNTVRANYPASKRCVEALCNAYAAENDGFDFVIARIGRFYGPTVIEGDAKAPSQFIGNAVRDEDIVMKSDGTQLYSWGYVGDCATGLLTILVKGERGAAYNVADPGSCAQLREFAQCVADAAGVSVVFAKQSRVEQSGYSKINKATMDISKLSALGWKAKFGIRDGISRTIQYLRSGV